MPAPEGVISAPSTGEWQITVRQVGHPGQLSRTRLADMHPRPDDTRTVGPVPEDLRNVAAALLRPLAHPRRPGGQLRAGGRCTQREHPTGPAQGRKALPVLPFASSGPSWPAHVGRPAALRARRRASGRARPGLTRGSGAAPPCHDDLGTCSRMTRLSGIRQQSQATRVPEGFEVLGELGRGSTAVVWHARYALTGEEVALKVWSRSLRDEHQRRRFTNECRWHRELSGHPNIVRWVWASNQHDEMPWLRRSTTGRPWRITYPQQRAR